MDAKEFILDLPFPYDFYQLEENVFRCEKFDHQIDIEIYDSLEERLDDMIGQQNFYTSEGDIEAYETLIECMEEEGFMVLVRDSYVTNMYNGRIFLYIIIQDYYVSI